MGMVGGGRDAFIGGVHRMATRLDGEIELVAGAFSSDPEKAKRSGEDLSLESERVYRDYQTMVETEARLPVGKRRLRVDSHSKPPPYPDCKTVSRSRVQRGLR